MSVEVWPLARLLNLPPAWGGDTWADVVEFALNDPGDIDVITVLADTLARHGQFRDPVRVDTDDRDGCDYIGNGMHRILTHILTGHDQVQVTRDAEPSIEAAWEATMMLPDPDVLDAAFLASEALSLPVDDDTWLERCGAHSCGLEFTIQLIATRVLPDTQLADLVASFLTRHGIPVEPRKLTLTRQWWTDEE